MLQPERVIIYLYSKTKILEWCNFIREKTRAARSIFGAEKQNPYTIWRKYDISIGMLAKRRRWMKYRAAIRDAKYYEECEYILNRVIIV